MARYRKRPEVLQAELATREVEAEQATEREVFDPFEPNMVAEIGDWIVTAADGKRYPVIPLIFEMTYELEQEEQTITPGDVGRIEDIFPDQE